MAKISKRKKQFQDLVVPQKHYSLSEAIKIIVEDYASKCKVKFNETFELAIQTGINTQKNETIKGSANLPHGTGKKVKIGVFAEGEDAKAAAELGAEILTIESVKAGNVNFDSCVATPDMMPKLVAVARILGPRGLMPNPKLGTVTKDIAKVVSELSSGRVDFRNDKQGNVNLGVGKVSFAASQIEENINAVINSVKNAKPTTLKGAYIKGITLSSTMGVGVRVSLESLS